SPAGPAPTIRTGLRMGPVVVSMVSISVRLRYFVGRPVRLVDTLSDEVRFARHGQTSLRPAGAGRIGRCDPARDPRGGTGDAGARPGRGAPRRRGRPIGRRLAVDGLPAVRLAGRAVRRAGAAPPLRGRLRRAAP